MHKCKCINVIKVIFFIKVIKMEYRKMEMENRIGGGGVFLQNITYVHCIKPDLQCVFLQVKCVNK